MILLTVSQSLKNVSFSNLTVDVQNWASTVKHNIVTHKNVLLNEFLVNIRIAFSDELPENPKFTLYAFVDGIIPDLSDTNVNIKESRILTDDQLSMILQYFETPYGIWPLLYIFDEVEEKKLTTPTHSPSPKRNFSAAVEEENGSETFSTTSRDSSMSKLAKKKDNNQCIICELKGFANLEGCHVYEIHEYNNLAEQIPEHISIFEKEDNLFALKQNTLHDLDLVTINDITNMDSMCRACHEYYDSHKLTISPCRRIIISNDIRNNVANPYNPRKYVQFHGKLLPEVQYPHMQVKCKVREHRFNKFLQAHSIVGTFYCLTCIATFNSEYELKAHENLINCNTKLTSKITPIDDAEVQQLIKGYDFLNQSQSTEYELFLNTDALKLGKTMNKCKKDELIRFLKEKQFKGLTNLNKTKLLLKVFTFLSSKKE